MKKVGFFLVVLFCVAILGDKAQMANLSTVRSGEWSDPLTWGNSPTGPIPGTGDFVTILSGHTVSVANETTVNLYGISVQADGKLSLTSALNCGVGDGGFSNAGTINGSGPFRAQGVNQFFFAQTGTLTAPLEIFQSSTIVNGAVDGAVTVMSGGSLKGTGPFNGPLTVALGGTLGGAGVMTVTNNVTLNGTLSSPAGCCPGLTFNFSGSTFNNNGSVVAPISFDFNFKGSSQRIDGAGTWKPTNIVIKNGATVSLGNEVTMDPFGFSVEAGGTLLLTHRLNCGVNSGGFSNAGTINGSAPLRAQGSYQFAFTQAGNLTAPLEVFNSSTIVNGAVNGAVTVVSGGLLMGTGPFNEPITVAAGGTLGGAGVMTVNNNVTLNGTLSSPAGCCPGLTFNFSGSTFANNGSVIAPISFEFNFQGTTQSLSGTGVFVPSNARIHSGSTLTLGTNHQMNNVTIDAGGTMDITGRTLSLLDHEPITNNGTIITTGSTIVFNGPSYQHLGLTANITYNNLIINNPEVLLSGDVTVIGVFALNNFDLVANGGTRTLTMPASASSTGTGDVVARIKRTGFTLGTPLSFGNPNNTIRFDSGAVPADVTMELAKQPPSSFPTAIARTYNITANGGSGSSATVRLHYQDADLRGNPETTLGLWRFDGANWASQGRTASNTTFNWVERSGVSTFSLWTLASANLPADVVITHLLPDRGGNTGTVSSVIHGRGFEQGASVKLVRIGQLDVVGISPNVREGGLSLAVTFDLTAKSLGKWDVEVMNPGGEMTELKDGFTIEGGRELEIWVDVVGSEFVGLGRDQTYNVIYGNRGNINAYAIPIWIKVPSSVEIVCVLPLLQPPTVPGGPPVEEDEVPVVVETENSKFLPLVVPVIPPGTTGTIPIRVKSLQASLVFPIQVWANPPMVFTNFSVELGRLAFEFDPQFLTCFSTIVLEILGIPVDDCIQDFKLALLNSLSIHTSLASGDWQGLRWSLGSILISFRDCAEKSVGKKIPLYGLLQRIISVIQVFDDCKEVAQRLWEQIVLIHTIGSIDPNNKYGPSGEGSLRQIASNVPMQFSISFENLASATAPAQQVDINDHLDTSKLDMSTISLGPITFGENRLVPAYGSREFAKDVDLRPNKNLIVRVEARLDADTGLITWRFVSIDPLTGQLPEDPLIGFLPPNASPPQGEGNVLFTVIPKEGLSTGTQIRNRAKIIFDTNAPIDTPEWFNTIDNAKPTSHVLPLASPQCAGFLVNWSGSDSGAGILDYTIFVTENNGPFTSWLTNTTETSAVFTGRPEATYGFFSVARDRTGNVEKAPAIADAFVTVNDAQAPVITGARADKPSLWPPDHKMVDVTVNYNVTDNCDTSSKIICKLSVTSNEPINGTGDGDMAPDWEIVDAHHLRLRAEKSGNGNGRIYTITITCTDSLGNSSMTTVTVAVPKNRS